MAKLTPQDYHDFIALALKYKKSSSDFFNKRRLDSLWRWVVLQTLKPEIELLSTNPPPGDQW